MSDWKDAYAAYDDEVLTLLANPGLVRRAAKLVPTAAWDGDAVKVGDMEVRLDERGPANGRCPCPTAGICVHILAASMFVRDGLLERGSSGPGPQDGVRDPDFVRMTVADGTTGSGPQAGAGDPDFVRMTPTEDSSPCHPAESRISATQLEHLDDYSPVLAEVLSVNPTVLCRRAGATATRQAYSHIKNPVQVDLTGNAHWLDIRWSDNSVRYVAGAGWDGMVATGEKKDRPALQLEGIARLFQSQGRDWQWPDTVAAAEPATGTTDHTRQLTASVRWEIERGISVGLSHLGEDAGDRMADLVLTAKAGGLPLLSRYLGTTAALLDGVAAHRDETSEAQAISSLANSWGLATALDHAEGEAWTTLRGTARREYEVGDSMTLMPLGATWWVNPSGARGLTLTAWDMDAGEVREATSARPVGTDSTFYRSREMTALWSVPLSTLLDGPFRLDGPRLSADGNLSATAQSVTKLSAGFDEEVLRGIAGQLAPTDIDVSFADSGRGTALVAVKGFGEVLIDEPQQQLVWSLPLPEGEWQLRQEITLNTVHRVDTLLAWDADKARLAYVLARRAVIRGRSVWEPATLFLRQHAGMRMACLDFPTSARTKLTSVLQKRWERLRQRWQKPSDVPDLPRSAVAQVCDDVRDVLTDLAATGRLTPTAEQQRRCRDLASRCDDLALSTLAALARGLIADPGPQAVLRTQLVADRAAALASSYE